MTEKEFPIGVFDSGLGGLTVWEACHKLLPTESFVYLADHAYVPYGTKSVEAIRKRVLRCIDWLIQKQCKLVVIACNTATVAGIDVYRKNFPELPLVGVVPVIKKAAEITKTNHIAVLSTPFTARSLYQQSLINMYAQDKIVTTVASANLVSLIESGNTTTSAIESEVSPIFASLSKNVDTLVLGCTHFPFVADVLQKKVGANVRLIDSAGAVARQVLRVLTNNQNLGQSDSGNSLFFTTGDHEKVSLVAKKLLKRSLSFSHVPL